MAYQLDDLTIDPTRREIRRGGEVLHLSKLSFDVLLAIIEAAPALLTFDALIDKAWGQNRVVTPENLSQRITVLRKNLGDDAQQPRYIEVVRGQGFRLIPEVREQATAAPPTIRKNTRIGLAVAALGLLMAVGWMWSSGQKSTQDATGVDDQPTAALPAIDLTSGPSVAVLPFVNMSDDPNNEYFADGISEEIINSLVQQTNLPIIGRTSSFQFKNQQIGLREIGEQLNATHLLEGSVRRDGDRVRVTAQLIDSPTGLHLWSEQYDRGVEDLLVIQTEIAASIVDQIQSQLQAQGESRLRDILSFQRVPQRGTMGAAAYDAYLQGLQHKNRMVPRDIRRALVYFEEATRLSPESLPAWQALIETELIAINWDMALDFPVNGYNRIEQWLETAQTYNPEAPYLRMIHGLMLALNHYRWQEGLDIVEQALPELGSNAEALATAASLFLILERVDKADQLVSRALQLEPALPSAIFKMGAAYILSGRQQMAIDLLPENDYEYVVGLHMGLWGHMMSQLELVDKGLRMARPYVGPDHTAIRSIERLYYRNLGEHEKGDAIAAELLEEMRDKPVYALMVYPNEDRHIRAAIEQREWMWAYFAYLNRDEEEMRPWVEMMRLDELAEPESRLKKLSESEKQRILASEVPLTREQLASHTGTFGIDQRAIHISLDGDRLHYRDRSWSGTLVPVAEHRFISLDELQRELECETNDAGEIDLCFWTRGSLKFYGYRQDTEHDVEGT